MLLADGLLPLLSPRVAEASNEQELSRAAIRVLEGTLRELQAMLASDENTQYDPALRLTIAHYRVRLARARESVDDTCSQQIGALATQVREVQEKAAEAIHEKGARQRHAGSYYAMLRGVRARWATGCRREGGLAVFHSARPSATSWQRTAAGGGKRPGRALRHLSVAIELEHAAIDYLRDVVDQHDGRQGAAQLLWRRSHGAELPVEPHQPRPGRETAGSPRHHADPPPGPSRRHAALFGGQFAEAARYAVRWTPTPFPSSSTKSGTCRITGKSSCPLPTNCANASTSCK
ncbi:MAG: hypothetical protein ACLUE1_06220 [Adlercreutzia equolifaciens]